MIVNHVHPSGWVDTSETGVIQPSGVVAMGHSVTLEGSDFPIIDLQLSGWAVGHNSVQHGLGRHPKLFDLYIKCKVASNNYSVGDVAKPYAIWNGSSVVYAIEMLYADSTTIGMHVLTGYALLLRSKASPYSPFMVLPANWNLLFRVM